MVYLITYDLNKPGQKYDDLYEAIKNSSTYWVHFLDSAWIIKSALSVNQVSNNIRAKVDESDNFLVIEVTNNKQGWLPQKIWEYINNSIF